MKSQTEKDAEHFWFAMVVIAIASLCAPKGWGWTVFCTLLVLSHGRRTHVYTERDP